MPRLQVSTTGRRSCGEQRVLNDGIWYRPVAEVANAATGAHRAVEPSAGVDHTGVAQRSMVEGYFMYRHSVQDWWTEAETLPELRVVPP